MVLGRVQDLEQGGGGIPTPIRPNLVHLVQQDHRVHGLGIAQRPDQPARHRPDVGTAVPPDLRLVANPAERHADELASKRAGDRLADRGLAGSGRPDKGQDRSRALVVLDVAFLPQLAHRDVLDYPPLHVLQAGMVGIQDLAGDGRIEPLLGALRPGDREQGVEVGPDHGCLPGLLAHPLKTAQLPDGLLLDGLGHLGLRDLPLVLLDDRGVVVTELLADRLHLLAQEVIALLLLGAGLDVVADSLADLKLGQALALHLERKLETLGHVDRLQKAPLVGHAQVGAVAGGVGERARLADRAQEGADAAIRSTQLEDLLDHGAVLALELACPLVGWGAVVDLLHLDA